MNINTFYTFLVYMLEEIYKKTGLTKNNQIYSLSCIQNILNLNECSLFVLFTEHKPCYEKITCNSQKIVSLVEILLESKVKHKIIPLINFYDHPRVLQYYCTFFENFSIASFLKSSLYAKILQCEYHELDDSGKRYKIDKTPLEQFTGKNTLNDKNLPKLESLFDPKEHGYSICSLQVIDFLYKFISLVINNFYDQVNCAKMIAILPSHAVVDINLNLYTFIPVIKKSEYDVHKLMCYKFLNVNEIYHVKQRLKNKVLLQNVVKYINSQEIINTTILIYAILINNRSFHKMKVSNIDYDIIIKLCRKSKIYKFDNICFKDQFLSFVVHKSYDVKLMLVLIVKNSFVEYKAFINATNKEYMQKELYLLYFMRKRIIVDDKEDLRRDIIEIITNKIYDLAFLEFLIVNDIDLGLIKTQDALNLLLSSNNTLVRNKCMLKYQNDIVEHKITVSDAECEKLRRIKTWLKQNENLPLMLRQDGDERNTKSNVFDSNFTRHALDNPFEYTNCDEEKIHISKIDFLPILANFDNLKNAEICKIAAKYAKTHDLNDFIHFLDCVTLLDDELVLYIKQNFELIKNPVYKLRFIDTAGTNIDKCNSLIETINKKQRYEFVSRIKNYDLFTEHFLRNDKFCLAINQKVVSKYYHFVQNHLTLLKTVKVKHIDEKFTRFYLYELFNSKYDTTSICEVVNEFLLNQVLHKKVIVLVLNFYLQKVLKNDFFQEKDFNNTKNILELAYLYITLNGNDKRILEKCEDIFSLLRTYQQYFDVEILIGNYKSINRKSKSKLDCMRFG